MKLNFLIINYPVLRKMITEKTKYLIMNEWTLNLLKVENIDLIIPYENKKECYDTFCGVPIAICNSLSNGCIDVIE